MSNLIGIYSIRNVINNKYYIGSSIQVNRRLNNHKSLLIRGKHHSYKLQEAYNKHGKDSFKFELLEEIQFPINYSKVLQQEYLECLEEFYINKYESYTKGYNVSKIPKIVGNTNTPESIQKGINTRREKGSYIISEITRQRRSDGLKNSELFKRQQKLGALKRAKVIYQYSLDGEFIREWKSIQELSEKLGIFESMIRKSISGQNHRCKNFIFSYIKYDKVLSYKDKLSRRPPKLIRSIKMYDSYNNLLKIYSDYKECARDLKVKENTVLSYMTRPLSSLNYKLEYGTVHR